MKIKILRDTETVRYAAEEFKKYLEMMDESLDVEITPNGGDITLGLIEELGLPSDGIGDAVYDDVIDIKVDNMKGYIAGSNERSILMGVYNFLKSAGCMWVRPGKEGEYIPKKKMASHSFSMRKKADHTFRGQCIEGAVSYENVRDTVMWLPKVNMNVFMIQMVVPSGFFSRWYKHNVSTVKENEGKTYSDYENYTVEIEKTIKKCGLQLHSVGHGYLLEPYGIHWTAYDEPNVINDAAREDVALVNGKRDLFIASAKHTQLCYSKDKARLGLVNYLVEYLEQKPYTDFLHVWLADALGNQCECENCKKKIPTDFYVQMLNELDAALTKKGITTKIIFIMYNDTYWPPEFARFINPDRFILTTAAAGRDYSKGYSAERAKGNIPAFNRNNFRIKRGLPTTMQFLDAWKPIFDGRRFLFEYQMYTDHFFDPGYMTISKHILDDCKHVKDIEFDGIMCCQTQRSYFPTGLPDAIMGEGLFDKQLDFDDYANRFLAATYGENWQAVKEYLEKISVIFDPATLRVNDSIVEQDTGTGKEVIKNSIRNNPETASRLSGVAGLVDSFLPVIESNMNAPDICHRESYKILSYHAEYCKRLADVFIALANDDMDKTIVLFNDMIDYLSKVEDEIQPYFDMVLFHKRVGQVIDRK